MFTSDRLGGMLKEVEVPLGVSLKNTLRGYLGSTEWLDSDLQLTYSLCGIATAALQTYLQNQGISSCRLIQHINIVVTDEKITDQHVLLETYDKDIIDPTYTQYLGLVGLSSHLAQQFSDMRRLLPTDKIIKFPSRKHDIFAREFSDIALKVRSEVDDALSTRTLNFHHTSYPLENIPAEIVTKVYKSIWDIRKYEEFPIEAQVAKWPGFQDCVNDVVKQLD